VTPGGGIGDSLFGFRVYPIVPLMEIFQSTRGMRGFDFDSEAAIRMRWLGVHAINVATPVRYFHRDEGGVSHFKYVRDNLLLAAMYGRLLVTLLVRLWARRMTSAETGTGYAPARHGSYTTNPRKTASRAFRG
jgi:hypothetical protein